MNIRLILRVVCVLLIMIAGFMASSLIVVAAYGEWETAPSFIYPIVGVLLVAVPYIALSNNVGNTLSTRSGFLLVTLSWVCAAGLGAAPFVISGAIPSLVDAWFESMSGFTTTGASILTEIESLPKSILYWRSLTHWLGGMGIIVLTVAILPLLGIGGMQLVRAESPGPDVDKFTPKVTATAKILWLIYVGISVLETVLLRFGGMSLFDAVTHTFGTLATGGFSTRNASVGAYNSAYIDIVITVFMVMAGINFSMYFRLISGRLKSIAKDTELKVYLAIFILSSILIAIDLHGSVYQSFGEALRYSGFQAASILTTTGYATADFDMWPATSRVLLFLLMFVGGSAGSTGGGVKVVRIVALFKQAHNEMRQLVHPRGVFRVRINGVPVRGRIILAITGFFFLYVFLLLLTTLVTASGGHGLLTSFSTALVTLGNIGPGFAMVGPTQNYAFFQDYIKVFTSIMMLVGRLELYTVLVLFTPAFWRD